jgi:formylmethanofuran dehydrogenase subunit E
MQKLQEFLMASAQHHRGCLCPRQVLGVRIGMYAAELFALDLPQTDKRLFAFVETDGCLVDGIAVTTNCSIGSRTMRIMDYGKSAATFVDTLSNRAIRITPRRESRSRAFEYAPNEPDRWHAQLAAYQIMPVDELLCAQEVQLTVSLSAIISQHGHRVICAECGEDIINEREVCRDDAVLCRACAGDAYYSDVHPAFFDHAPDKIIERKLTSDYLPSTINL